MGRGVAGLRELLEGGQRNGLWLDGTFRKVGLINHLDDFCVALTTDGVEHSLNRVQGQVIDDSFSSLLVCGVVADRTCSLKALDGDLEIKKDASLHADHLVQELVFP